MAEEAAAKKVQEEAEAAAEKAEAEAEAKRQREEREKAQKEGAQAHRGAKPTVARGLKLAAWGARAKRRVRARKAAKFVAATIPFVRRDEGEEAEAAEKAEEARRDSASGMLEEMLARARAGGGASEPSSPEPDHPRIRPQQGEAATASESEGATPAKRWAAAGTAHGVTSSGGAGPVTERRGGSTTRRGGGTTRRGAAQPAVACAACRVALRQRATGRGGAAVSRCRRLWLPPSGRAARVALAAYVTRRAG